MSERGGKDVMVEMTGIEDGNHDMKIEQSDRDRAIEEIARRRKAERSTAGVSPLDGIAIREV